MWSLYKHFCFLGQLNKTKPKLIKRILNLCTHLGAYPGHVMARGRGPALMGEHRLQRVEPGVAGTHVWGHEITIFQQSKKYTPFPKHQIKKY